MTFIMNQENSNNNLLRGRPKTNPLTRKEQLKKNSRRYRNIKKLEYKSLVQAIKKTFLTKLPIVVKILKDGESQKVDALNLLNECLQEWESLTKPLLLNEELIKQPKLPQN